MDRREGALGAAILAALLAGPLSAQGPLPADWRIERVDRELKALPGAPLAIRNPWGDLRVRAGEEGRVVVHAVVQHDAGDARPVAIESSEEAGARVVAVAWAPDDGASPPGWARRRVDLAVEVPERAALSVRTERGLIEVKGHAGPLEARSVAGDLRLRVAGGPVDALTERGSILAVLAAEVWRQAARFEAPSGDVEVHFPARTDASVLLETRGALTTDFSLDVERLGPLAKRARAQLGRGGPEVVLRSGRGDLRILGLLAPPVPEVAPAPPAR
ncbi:MAG: hypothetical protein F9K18_05330 [Thermoanaerobaculia bacterium]|nr:MAG: hypothetical protein F9K18_05330 [Thermoanaerobaculia bacterium]